MIYYCICVIMDSLLYIYFPHCCVSHVIILILVALRYCTVYKCLVKTIAVFIFRALESKYFTYDQMELMDPAVMFAIPRLAIIRYALTYIHIYMYTYRYTYIDVSVY